NHEFIDEVLLNGLDDKRTMTFYCLPPLSQTPTSSHEPRDVRTDLVVLLAWNG
ncbi:Gibberellin 2-beta-dioxygenase 1, partial [Dissostichus eleginoides]